MCQGEGDAPFARSDPEMSPLEGVIAAMLGPYPTGQRVLEGEVLVQEMVSSNLCEVIVNQHEKEQMGLCDPFCHSSSISMSSLRRDLKDTVHLHTELWETPADRG